MFDEVFVGDCREAAAFISVEVDVVNVEGGRHQAGGRNAVADLVGGGTGTISVVPAEVGEGVEFQVDLHFVVLQGNQRQSEARVAAEPELERDVHGVFRGAVADFRGGVGFTSTAVRVAGFTALDQQVDEFRDIANHFSVTGLFTGFLGELVPDVEPITVVLVDALATDFEFNVGDQVVANPVEPAELSTRTIGCLELNLGECGLEVHAVDQISVTGDCACDLLAEVRGAIEGLFNGFHREVCVATVDDLEDKEEYPPFREISEPSLSRGWTIT